MQVHVVVQQVLDHVTGRAQSFSQHQLVEVQRGAVIEEHIQIERQIFKERRWMTEQPNHPPPVIR
eukprot:6960725-Pyramimonas_sp.AAC.1